MIKYMPMNEKPDDNFKWYFDHKYGQDLKNIHHVKRTREGIVYCDLNLIQKLAKTAGNGITLYPEHDIALFKKEVTQ